MHSDVCVSRIYELYSCMEFTFVLYMLMVEDGSLERTSCELEYKVFLEEST